MRKRGVRSVHLFTRAGRHAWNLQKCPSVDVFTGREACVKCKKGVLEPCKCDKPNRDGLFLHVRCDISNKDRALLYVKPDIANGIKGFLHMTLLGVR